MLYLLVCQNEKSVLSCIYTHTYYNLNVENLVEIHKLRKRYKTIKNVYFMLIYYLIVDLNIFEKVDIDNSFY